MNDPKIQIGHDILEIQRVRDVYSRRGNAFLERILSPEEYKYCLQFADPIPRVAARFSAKESIAKALRVGIGSQLAWKDMEILPSSNGAPIVLFSPHIREKFCNPEIQVSISHCRLFVSTVAILVIR